MSTTSIKNYMNLFEANYIGPHSDNPQITYSAEDTGGKINKVIATLSADESGKYTKLGRNLKRIELLNKQVEKLKEQVKADTKAHIEDMFHAEDEVHTRVIDTVGFLFTLSKKPEATKTVKYAEVLKALEKQLTPELITVLENLKADFTSTVHKSPSLKAIDKVRTESVNLNEGIWDKLEQFWAKAKNVFTSWGQRYDAKLDALKAEVGINESLEEDDQVEELSEASDEFTRGLNEVIQSAMAYGKAATDGNFKTLVRAKNNFLADNKHN